MARVIIRRGEAPIPPPVRPKVPVYPSQAKGYIRRPFGNLLLNSRFYMAEKTEEGIVHTLYKKDGMVAATRVTLPGSGGSDPVCILSELLVWYPTDWAPSVSEDLRGMKVYLKQQSGEYQLFVNERARNGLVDIDGVRYRQSWSIDRGTMSLYLPEQRKTLLIRTGRTNLATLDVFADEYDYAPVNTFDPIGRI